MTSIDLITLSLAITNNLDRLSIQIQAFQVKKANTFITQKDQGHIKGKEKNLIIDPNLLQAAATIETYQILHFHLEITLTNIKEQ